MVILLILALVVGLFLIPFGLPGLWLMVGAILLYSYAVPTGGIGTATVVGTALAALVAEGIEFVLAGRYAKKYGGSRRSAWGAILGGIVGAIIGVPIPIVGSVIGGFAGSFAGAWFGEATGGSDAGLAARVATGALLGRVVATAMKVGLGVAIAVWTLFALVL